MRLLLVVWATFIAHSAHVRAQFNSTLTNWIATENVTALGRIFADIGSKGEFATDGDPGAIVASPSTANPDYYFQILPSLLRSANGTGFVILL